MTAKKKPRRRKMMMKDFPVCDNHALRGDLEELRIDVAIIKSNSTNTSEVLTELRNHIMGDEGLSHKVGILWDRQEQHRKLLVVTMAISVVAVSTSAADVLKILNLLQ